MKDFEYYLGIANHDIQMSNDKNELKDYVASLLCEYDTLRNENTKINQKYLNAVSDYEQEKFKVDELKIQFKFRKEQYNNLLIEYEKSLEDYSRLDAINRTQQKEFIKFLGDNWEQTQDIWYIKILNKYKEIIGEHNEQ